ncbi:extracellular solute-binding protein [Paenibacillus thalictri]|nr:extracellular solute-binding protein [Paenibacillus thalictri]
MNTHSSKLKQGVAVIALLSVITAACGTPEEKKQDKAAGASAPEGPVTISMMNIYQSAEPPKMDSEAMKLLQEYTNTKLNITWVPNASYSEKVNASIAAAGELPQVMLIKDDRNPAIIEAARAGMFWEVGPYLKDYPNLSKLDKTRFNNIAIDGKTYGIYRWRPIARNGIILRKDWLDNLGLQEPKTIDDLMNVFKAFTTGDPDKNGKNDTYGLSLDTGGALFSHFLTELGGPNNWLYKDGAMVPAFMTKEYMDTMKLLRQMFQDKMINSDFPLVKDRIVLVNQGKAGAYIGAYDDLNARFTDLYKNNPNAKLDAYPNVQGPAGVRLQGGTGYNSVFMFPKTSVKTEAELKKVLTFMDKLGDEKVINLVNWGIEGKHYKMENGKAARIDEKVYTDEVYNNLFQLMVFDNEKMLPGKIDPSVEKYTKFINDNEKYAVMDPTINLISNTYMEKGKQLDSIIVDARTKFIMGELDEKGFEQMVGDWRKNGGDKIIAEYKEQYEKNAKK